MNNISPEERKNALTVISATISNCEKMQPKFDVGTSQSSLLRNRIKALEISKCLIADDGGIETYTRDELERALPPVISIIHKTEKAQSKYEESSTQHRRLMPVINAMHISKVLIEEELSKRISEIRT